MHRVGSAGNTSSSVRPRKEKRLTYVLNDADDTKVRSLTSIDPRVNFKFKRIINMLNHYD